MRRTTISCVFNPWSAQPVSVSCNMAKLMTIAVALLACALPLATASRQLPVEEEPELANSGRELTQYYNDVGEV